MVIYHLFLLTALPVCLAQFSIQGPSDGNRRSQGLKYSKDKGIEYTDQRESLGAGDFSIQGASDGNGDFRIQGASDGNADFQIQGATDGNADFHIQGATDGNSDFRIQGATDGNADFQIQGATDGHESFRIQSASNGYEESPIVRPYSRPAGAQNPSRYEEPRGSKSNLRAYSEQQYVPRPVQPSYNPAPEYQRAPSQQPAREVQQASAPAARTVKQKIVYSPFQSAPSQIKQLLQFQSQIPYLNPIPEHLRYEQLIQTQATVEQHQPSQAEAPVQELPQEAPQYRSKPQRRPRPRRQVQEQQHQRQAQQPQQQQQQYSRRPPPAPEAVPNYSQNPPPEIQKLIQFLQRIPYENGIPEQFRYNLDKAPAPVPPQGTHQRSKRQAQQHQQKQQQVAPQLQQQYRRIPEPAPEALPRYSSNAPAQIQQLLQFQAQIPYQNAIPEQFRYNLDKAPAPAPSQVTHQRSRRQAQQQHSKQQQATPQQQYKRIPEPAPEALPRYSTNTPAQIQQLLQFQAQIPYQNAIPEQFRYNLDQAPVQSHSAQDPQGGHRRSKRQEQKSPQPQYRRISQPAVEPLPQYSSNLPQNIKQILQFQSQTPYNIIANQINYRLDKPYVPQRVASSPPNSPSSNDQNQGPSNVRPPNVAH